MRTDGDIERNKRAADVRKCLVCKFQENQRGFNSICSATEMPVVLTIVKRKRLVFVMQAMKVQFPRNLLSYMYSVDL